MRPTKLSTMACAAAAAALSLAACGSSGSNSGSSAHPTLTYWASNQGTSLQDDQQVLAPQIAKFTKQTGIKVKVQVIPWTTLLTQITAATATRAPPLSRPPAPSCRSPRRS
jgi:multiple sugar transport system substrate-binding protein